MKQGIVLLLTFFLISSCFSIPLAEMDIENKTLFFYHNDKIIVSYKVPDHFQEDNGWIAFVPNEVTHGDPEKNEDYAVATQGIHYEEGQVNFYAPISPGLYSIRMFDSEFGGEEVAALNLEVLATEDTQPKLLMKQTKAEPGSEVEVFFTNAPGNEKDWIGLYSLNDEDNERIDWEYIYGEETGSIVFRIPEKEAKYNFRLFENDDYERLAITPDHLIVSENTSKITHKEQQLRQTQDPDIVEEIGMETTEIDTSREKLMVIKEVLCHNYDENKMPVDPKVIVPFEDYQVMLWTQLSDFREHHVVKWEWIDPEGNLSVSYDQEIPAASKKGIDKWDDLAVMGFFKWSSCSEDWGIWKVRFFIDGEMVLIRQYKILEKEE